MEAGIDIPAPLPGDSDTVVASLETAAVFGAKGDTSEALRWLQRAAESAGEGSDDARTLALAQTLANLKSRVSGAEPERRLPSPPPRVSSAPSAPAEGEQERPFLLESRAVVQGSRPPSPREPRASTPPPPPSARSRPAPAASAAAMAPSAAPTPANGARAKPASAPPSAGPAPKATAPTPPKLPQVVRPTPASGTPVPAVTRGAQTPPPPGASPAPTTKVAPKSVTPSVLGAPPVAAVALARSAPTRPPPVNGESLADGPTASVDHGSSTRRPRQAARVSIVKSLTERGLYFVRVLDEGQSPPDDGSEGLLVSSDPNVTLL